MWIFQVGFSPLVYFVPVSLPGVNILSLLPQFLRLQDSGIFLVPPPISAGVV